MTRPDPPRGDAATAAGAESSRWRFAAFEDHDVAELAAWAALVLCGSWLFVTVCFVTFGFAPFVLRWAAVNAVATAAWCYACVRREAVRAGTPEGASRAQQEETRP